MQSVMLSNDGENDESGELYGVDVCYPALSHSLRSPSATSLTHSASPSSLRSSSSPPAPFTARPIPPGSMLPNNSSPTMDLLPLTSNPLRLRTRSCQNKRPLYYTKSWSTSIPSEAYKSHPGQASVVAKEALLELKRKRGVPCFKRGIYSQPFGGT